MPQVHYEDGGHYLLQAAGQLNTKHWVETIERVSKMTAKRLLTYLDENDQPQMLDELLAKPAVATRDPVAGTSMSWCPWCMSGRDGWFPLVFVVELEFLLQHAPDREVQGGTVPVFLERLINEIEHRGLTEVGICECCLPPCACGLPLPLPC